MQELMENKFAGKKMHEAYVICKEVFAPDATFLNDHVVITDEEEALFCRMASDFFIRQKQKEIINR